MEVDLSWRLNANFGCGDSRKYSCRLNAKTRLEGMIQGADIAQNLLEHWYGRSRYNINICNYGQILLLIFLHKWVMLLTWYRRPI